MNKKFYRVGLVGIIVNYGISNFFISLVKCLFASVLVTYVGYYYGQTNDKLLDLLIVCVDSLLSFLPNLLGFMLGGFTILITFSDEITMKKLTTSYDNDKPTLYQTLSAIFSFCIIIIGLCIGLAFLYKIFLTLKIPFEFALYVNFASLVILLTMFFYGLLSLYDTVKNLFAFSQYHHRNIVKKSVKDKEKHSRQYIRSNI